MAWRMFSSYIIHVPSRLSSNPVAKSRMTGVPRQIEYRCKNTHTPLWSLVGFGHKTISLAKGFFECAHPRPAMWQKLSVHRVNLGRLGEANVSEPLSALTDVPILAKNRAQKIALTTAVHFGLS